MGNLTDDMTRLRGEVDALRGARNALRQDLSQGAMELTAAVAAMRADFSAAHAAMAKKTKEERTDFVTAVIDEVNSLLGAFSRNRNDMARRGRLDREAFLTEMRKQVNSLCKETADDLMGARLVWRGQTLKKFRPVQLKKEPELAAPSAEAVTPVLSPREPLPKDEAKGMEAAPVPEAPAVEPPKVKAAAPVFAASAVTKEKEKSWLDEKPIKTATKGKRGKK